MPIGNPDPTGAKEKNHSESENKEAFADAPFPIFGFDGGGVFVEVTKLGML